MKTYLEGYLTKRYGAYETARIIGISMRQLNYWVLIGVVSPQIERHGIKYFRRYTEEDLNILKKIKVLTDDGYPISRAIEKLKK